MPVLNELFIFRVIWYKGRVTIVEELNFLWENCMLDTKKNFFYKLLHPFVSSACCLELSFPLYFVGLPDLS